MFILLYYRFKQQIAVINLKLYILVRLYSADLLDFCHEIAINTDSTAGHNLVRTQSNQFAAIY